MFEHLRFALLHVHNNIPLLLKSVCLLTSLLCQDTVFLLRRSHNSARLWFCGQQHFKVQP